MGTDDFYDDFDEFDDSVLEQQIEEVVNDFEEESFEESLEETLEESNSTGEDDFVQELLKSRGIEDLSKIKFEDEEGNVEEVDWNSLSTQDKLNILESSSIQPETGLDESEIQLINAIRSSQLTPQEYIQYIQKNSVDTYILNSLNQNRLYSIDQYSDDEIYVMDLISKTQDITEEEAIEALEKAKSNEILYKKQVTAMRNEYKKIEDENIEQDRIRIQEEQMAQFNQFAESIENSIINFKEFSGCELNMSNDDMQNLYEFITGRDNAGNSWFGKALNDPNTVVLMAWFVLNGEKMIQDITEYYNKEITNVRKQSYKKGLEDAQNKKSTYKPRSKKTDYYDDLDDF